MSSTAKKSPLVPAVDEVPSLKHHRYPWYLHWLWRLYRMSIPLRTKCHVISSLFTEKEMMMNRAMAFVEFNKVRGDYLEFGTYFGHSLSYAYHFARSHRVEGMRFYAFDSFQGLPEFKGVDKDTVMDLQYVPGDFACDVKTVKGNLRLARVRLSEVDFIEGFYDDSLTQELKKRLPIKAAAVIWIDCDLYHSTKQVLDWLTDYIVDGSVICFDDWFNFKGNPAKGENRAFTEWCAKNKHITASPYHVFNWHGKSFILNLKNGSTETE